MSSDEAPEPWDIRKKLLRGTVSALSIACLVGSGGVIQEHHGSLNAELTTVVAALRRAQDTEVFDDALADLNQKVESLLPGSGNRSLVLTGLERLAEVFATGTDYLHRWVDLSAPSSRAPIDPNSDRVLPTIRYGLELVTGPSGRPTPCDLSLYAHSELTAVLRQVNACQSDDVMLHLPRDAARTIDSTLLSKIKAEVDRLGKRLTIVGSQASSAWSTPIAGGFMSVAAPNIAALTIEGSAPVFNLTSGDRCYVASQSAATTGLVNFSEGDPIGGVVSPLEVIWPHRVVLSIDSANSEQVDSCLTAVKFVSDGHDAEIIVSSALPQARHIAQDLGLSAVERFDFDASSASDRGRAIGTFQLPRKDARGS